RALAAGIGEEVVAGEAVRRELCARAARAVRGGGRGPRPGLRHLVRPEAEGEGERDELDQQAVADRPGGRRRAHASWAAARGAGWGWWGGERRAGRQVIGGAVGQEGLREERTG